MPTAIAYNGNFYVRQLGKFENGFPGMVIKVSLGGQTQVMVDGLKFGYFSAVVLGLSEVVRADLP